MADEVVWSGIFDDGITAALAAIEEATASLEAAFSSLQGTADALSASLDALAGSMDGFDAAASAAAASEAELAAASDEAAVSIDTLNVSLDASETTVNNFMLTMGGLTAAIGAVASAFESIKSAGDFQAGLTSLVTGAGEAVSNLQLVSNGIKQLAVDTGTSTKQLIDGMYMIESAGYHGKAGLDILKAAAEGAKVGVADLGVVANGVTTIMTDYASQNISASEATNTLIATVAAGKTHMQDLAKALSGVLPAAAATKVGLGDVMAAMATMTSEGVPAANAATYLRQTIIALSAPAKAAQKSLADIGLTTQQVSDSMKQSLPATLQMIIDHLSKRFPEGSTAYMEALKNIAGGSKQLQGILDLTGEHMTTFENDAKSLGKTATQTGNSITGWTQASSDFNTKMSQLGATLEVLGINIGTALLPYLTQMVTAFTQLVSNSGPIVTTFGQITSAFQQVFGPAQKTAQATKGMADSFDRAKGIFHSTAQAHKPLMDSFDRGSAIIPKHTTAMHGATQATNPFVGILKTLKNVWDGVVAGFQAAIKFLQPIIKFVGDQLAPDFKQLSEVVKTQLKPAWDQFVQSMQPLLPLLGPIAEVIGGVLLLGLIAMAKAVLGAATVVALLLTALLNFMTMLQKVSNAVLTFIDNIIKWFQNLYNQLVGHSIIPDLINKIIEWFGKLPTLALQWGKDMIQKFIDGINSMIGNLSSAVSNVAQTISSHLHFSKPEVGPLANADTWMPDFVSMLSQGLQAGVGQLRQATATLATQGIAQPLQTSSSSALTNAITQLTSAVSRISIGAQPTTAHPMAVQQTFNNTFNGGSNMDAYTLYRKINQIAGRKLEGLSRGAAG